MKTKEEVLALFRAKYDHLKSVYPEVGSFDEAASTNFYQNPDGGWQLNLPPCAAITLRPGDDEAQMLDMDFVEMLEYGMPPTCGWGNSERNFWLFEGVSAREGVPFPPMRRDE